MSDETAAVESHEDAPTPELFTREELRSFDADDTEAGRNICKMLSLFFFYTVVAMAAMSVLTYWWINE